MLTPTASIPSSQPQRTTQADMGKKDIFLKMLVAQMQYQDPLKPQDPTAMSAQLAQFNMVEQQLSTNKLLESLVSLQSGKTGGLDLGSAAGYLGHTIRYQGQDLNYTGSPAPFEISLPADAAQVDIVIRDGSGATVHTLNAGALPAGSHALSWDGMTDSGTQAPSGAYRLEIQARDASGQGITADLTMLGTVQSVRFGPDGPSFMVGDIAVSPTAVTEITL